jgi:hypothetical protein
VGISEIMWLGHRMFAGCHNSRNRIRGVRSQLQLDRWWRIIICWSLELLPFLGLVLVSLQAPGVAAKTDNAVREQYGDCICKIVSGPLGSICVTVYVHDMLYQRRNCDAD